MTKVGDIAGFLEGIFPLSCEEKWDNSGLQLGSFDDEVSSVLIALDVDVPVVEEAVDKKANLLLTHHPLFFKPLKKLDYSSYMGRLVRMLVSSKISVYSVHTNFDNAFGGMNDILLEMLSLSSDVPLVRHPNPGCGGAGRVVELQVPWKVADVIRKVRESWGIDMLSYVGSLDRSVRKFAVCGGSGADFIENCVSLEVELYITADVKHHEAVFARRNGVDLLILNHFEMENASLGGLRNLLASEFSGVDFYLSTVYTNPVQSL